MPRWPAKTVKDRFLEKVDRRGDGECWPWAGNVLKDGYGRFKVNSTAALAHRMAWRLFRGEIPDGMQVDHICHNHACVNLSHLRLVTNKQNSEHRAGPYSNSTTGVRGITRNGAKWRARVGHNYRKHFVGDFDSLEEAEAAVISKRNELFTHNIEHRRKQ